MYVVMLHMQAYGLGLIHEANHKATIRKSVTSQYKCSREYSCFSGRYAISWLKYMFPIVGHLDVATSHINILRFAFGGRMIKVVENLVARLVGHGLKLSLPFYNWIPCCGESSNGLQKVL